MARFLKNTDPRFHLVELRSGFFLGVILLVLLGAVGFGIWRQEWFRGAKHYRMTAETSEGLQTGMAVRLSGFRIGKVDGIELVGPGEVTVSVKVFDEYVHYVKTDSRAEVRGENLIGDRFIELTAGSAGAPPAAEGAEIQIEAEPTIGAMVEELKEEFEPILVGLGGVAEKLPLTVDRVDRVIDESHALVVDLRREDGDLQQGFARLSAALAEIESLVAELRAPDNDMMKGIDQFEDATRAMSEHLDSILTKLDSASGRLDETLAKAGGLIDEADGVVGGLREAVDVAGPEVPEMVRKSSRTVDKADDVMSAVRDMWPIRGGVSKDDGKTLRTSSDD
ncbi:MlaD family protein [Haloferula sp. A504]|uniref:MlaD family protein n=1 Tax=Haloferula sp. A504 TaxID=3373601 RepID=UPI0031C19F54|nr:MlaD family protein [Verrucomicrobiaceae bacterium E54]